jgi:beta-glucosidase
MRNKKLFSSMLFILIAIGGIQVCAQTYTYPFQNPNTPLEDRVTNIISLMTQAEKISALSTNPSVSRLGIKGSNQMEGLHGLAMGGPGGWGGSTPTPTTQFPQSYGLGETWDPAVLQQAAAVEGNEARYQYHRNNKGNLVIRAPNADIGRDPRWGRTEECYGEDPYLNGSLVIGFVKGLQGNDPKYWQTAALMKHFLANSNEKGRSSSSSNFDQRLFREYYSVPFRMGVMQGGSRAFMAAYNAVNGVPCTANPILTNVTEKEWGLDGIICTDAGSLANLVNAFHFYPNLTRAAAGAVKAGISQFLDGSVYPAPVTSALDSSLLTVADIERVIKGNYRVNIRLGLLDPASGVSYTNVGAVDPCTTKAHKDVARFVTQKSIVLLKNATSLLPLNKTTVKSIAIIGAKADSVSLDWYSGTPPYRISPRAGIMTKIAGTSITVNYAADNTNNAAATAAQSSDVAIVFAGNSPVCNAGWGSCPSPSEGKEGIDRTDIVLQADQETLIKAVYHANPKTIVVLVCNFPYAITWEKDSIPTIIHMANNSEEMGNALADALFGDYNPAGRLNQTWPSALTQLPTMMDYNIRNGRTYMYFTGTPLFPFGHGLSYTTFTYANLTTSTAGIDAKSQITVSVDVTNSGTVDGEEVVQMYVKHMNSSVTRAIKELKGYSRVAIPAGKTQTVTLPLAGKDLAYWDSTNATWTVENDNVQIQIGASSADIRLNATLAVTNGGPVSIMEKEGNPPENPAMNTTFSALSAAQLLRRGPSIGLQFRLGAAADVDLRVFDLKGVCVGQVSRKNLAAGIHFVELQKAALSPGMYLVGGKVGGFVYKSKCFVK